MLNPISIMADQLGDYLSQLYMQYFSHRRPEFASYLGGAARLVLERIGNSTALYHNIEHTMMVTLAGQQIIRGRLLSQSVTPEDWLHYTCALLVHDIGFVRGVCEGDGNGGVVINDAGETFTPPRGASDACLAPFHIDRGKMYARERFGSSQMIDEERIVRSIEMTRFPVPDGPAYAETDTEAALVRAADLIGQLADPFYHRKINALYAEMCELGTADACNYTSASDMADKYPDFFREQVEPYIQPALGYLELTTEGKQWIANLNSNLFQIDSRLGKIGPFPGPGS
ncbi:MAG: metal-dependent phosphohydrolase [Rhizobiales bacterium]|nr:metal-dependent phosphohydrolase [Hyphomicrobiales bacterium]